MASVFKLITCITAIAYLLLSPILLANNLQSLNQPLTFCPVEQNLLAPVSPVNHTFTLLTASPNSYLATSLQLLGWGMLLILLFTYMGKLIIKRKQKLESQVAVQQSEARLKLALWASGDGMWDWDISSNEVTRTNITDPNLLEVKDHTLLSRIHDDDKALVTAALDRHLSGVDDFFEAEYRIKHPQGRWIWLLDRGKVVDKDQAGNPLRMAGTHKDITQRKTVENNLKLSQLVLNSMGEAVVVGNQDYQIISINPAFTAITGYHEPHVIEAHFLQFIAEASSVHRANEIENTLSHQDVWSGELTLNHQQGNPIVTHLEINKVYDLNGNAEHFVAVFNDITARKKAEKDLQYLANFDKLTGLPNRTLFQDRINHALAQASRNNKKLGLLFIDLDRFKHINDSLGHHLGDLLLQAVATRLQSAIRQGDTVARLAGDEFVIILEDIRNEDAAISVAKKLIAAFKKDFNLDSQQLKASASIGLSFFPKDAHDSEGLIKAADAAMYHAKSKGKNNYQSYTKALDENSSRYLAIETGLRHAIARNELKLMFQPKHHLKHNIVTGVEALVRWHSHELGEVSPAEFIPIAEEMGVINDIGTWVLNQACQQLASWHQQGLESLTIAVNLSVKQLRPDLVTMVEVALAMNNLPAHALELEITESTIMDKPEESARLFSQLKQLGISLAIDDFGTGYSSLSYLKRFPVNTLKIDREFVRGIENKGADATITNAIITLAHSLQLSVVAEGVEQQSQLDFLVGKDCDEVQGYKFSKPLAAADCFDYLSRWAL